MAEDDSQALLNALEDALALAGGPSALARACGISPAAVQYWRKAGRVPVEHLAKVAELSGIPVRALRPDLGAVLREE